MAKAAPLWIRESGGAPDIRVRVRVKVAGEVEGRERSHLYHYIEAHPL